jgi:Winged helix DNA-binding domain
MVRSLTPDEVLRRRLRSQQLAGPQAAEVAEVVRRMGAMQAQSTRDARLAVRPRGQGIDAAAVTEACNVTGSVVRTWAMRGTLQMLARHDVGWVVDLFRPPPGVVTARHRQLGLDASLFARALPAITEILSGRGPLTRAELVAELAARGVKVDPKTQAPAHLIGYAARHGVICRGPDRSNDEPTYVLLADWAGEHAPVGPDEALAELARRYAGAHGPATPADLAHWSGLPLGRARRGFELVAAELEEVDAAGEPAWMLPGGDDGYGVAGDAAPCVRLVPHFDEYLLGYRSRDMALPPRFARRIQAGGGWVRAAVLVDGRVTATWRQQRHGDQIVVTVEPFDVIDPAALPGLEAEAADLGRFQDTPATLRIESG